MAPLDIRSRDGADSTKLADAAVAHWHAIDAALSPIIGKLGVAALYDRSLFLAVKSHPWLAHEHASNAHGIDLPALRAVLVGRDASEISEGNATSLQAFMKLLAGLVGPSLAERLLGPLWIPPATGTAEQDTPA